MIQGYTVLCVYQCICPAAMYIHKYVRTYLGQVAEYSKSSFGLLQGHSVPVGRGNMCEKNWKSLAGGYHFTALLRHTSVELYKGGGREVTDMGQFTSQLCHTQARKLQWNTTEHPQCIQRKPL